MIFQNVQKNNKTKTTVLVSGYTWPMQKAIAQLQESKEPLVCVSCLDSGSDETIGTVVGMAEGGDSWLVEIEHDMNETAFIPTAEFLFINDSNNKVFLVQAPGHRREDLREMIKNMVNKPRSLDQHLEHNRLCSSPVIQTSSKNELGISVCVSDIGRGLTDEARAKLFQEQNPHLFKDSVLMSNKNGAAEE